MFDTIQRPYKERTTQETIAFIRQTLADLDLLPNETFHANPYPEIYSVSLEMPPEKGGFRANGKGRTADYCLASAYAEFIERLQNTLYAIFPRTIVCELARSFGFYYSPDEHYLDAEQFAAVPDPIITDIVRYTGDGRTDFMRGYYERVRTNGAPGVVAVPFYDTRNECTIYLPFNLLLLTVGSNGMAAGNTQAEAIFQALCELLERWGAAEVFYNRMAPPSVPREFLQQFEKEFAIIERIESSGKYRITVKDFSAGKRIPALGLLIENDKAGTYRLNVGSDTCFQVALSRCLTEVYQGILDENMFDACALKIPNEEAPYFLNDDADARQTRFMVFGEFIKSNSGQFPISLFKPEPDYEFDPTVWTQMSSYQDEVRRLVSYFHGMGHNVYIRDVGFLGFPAVYVYVPEVSAVGRKNVPPAASGATPIMLALDRIESRALKLKQCSDDDLAEIAQILETFSANAGYLGIFGLNLKPESVWKGLNTSFLLTQIYYRLGEIEKARASLSKYLETRKDHPAYYELVGQALERMAGGGPLDEVLDRLAEESEDKETVRQVREDLAEPARALDPLPLPNCPDCVDCELHPECLTAGKTAMARQVYPAMRRASIDQAALAWTSRTLAPA